MTALEVARTFVDRINGRDVAGLAALMAEDHHFIDSLGHKIDGRENMRIAWEQYFSLVPDYHLDVEQWLCDGEVVVLLATAAGSYSPDGLLNPARKWTTPTACRCVVRDDRVVEWRVYADNEPIRQLMRAGG